MWPNGCWRTSHKTCHGTTAYMATVFLTMVAVVTMVLYVNVSVYSIHRPVDDPALKTANQVKTRNFKAEQQGMLKNLPAYLNESSLDYGKGAGRSWAYYIPRGDLLFCPIAKVACAEWKRTMRWIGGLEEWEKIEHKADRQGNIPIVMYDPGKNTTPHFLNSGKIYNDLDACTVKMMAVRNPISRLLSGFKQKCVMDDENRLEYGNCPYLKAFPSIWKGKPPRRRSQHTDRQFNDYLAENGCYDLDVEGACTKVFAEFVNYIDTDMNKVGRCNINVHYRPHSCECNIWNNREQFSLLPFRRMAEYAVESLAESRGFSPNEKSTIGEFITYRIGTPQDDPNKLTNSSSYVDHFFRDNYKLREQVVRMYAYDYELMKDVLELA